jgi:hypothetical protein
MGMSAARMPLAICPINGRVRENVAMVAVMSASSVMATSQLNPALESRRRSGLLKGSLRRRARRALPAVPR